jgi:hypothetical protein
VSALASLRGDRAVVEMLPDPGAKVVSLRRIGGREWLAPPVRPVRRPPSPAGPWGDYDCAGWDECFPNVAPDPARGLADHGELWSRSWEVDCSGDALVATASARGHRLERTLRWEDEVRTSTLVASYRLLRTSDPAAPQDGWAWAQHPLLAASADMVVELPEPARVRVDSAWRDGRPDDDASWWAPGGVLAVATPLRSARGRAAKIWFEAPLPRWVRIRLGREWISWRTDESVPALGLWVNLGGWQGGVPLAHVAVEPAFGARDLLGADDPAGPALDVGEECRWRTTIHLGEDKN